MEEKTEQYTTVTTTHHTSVATTSDYSESSKTEQEVSLDEKMAEHGSSSVEEYDAQGNQINFVMSETERKLVRKLDYIYVMPFICVLNFLQVNTYR